MTKLRSINRSNDIADEIDKLNADLSRYIEAHPHTEEYAGGMPELNTLVALADRIGAVIDEAKNLRKSLACDTRGPERLLARAQAPPLMTDCQRANQPSTLNGQAASERRGRGRVRDGSTVGVVPLT